MQHIDVFLGTVPRSLARCEATYQGPGEQPVGQRAELGFGKVTKIDGNRECIGERTKKVT